MIISRFKQIGNLRKLTAPYIVLALDAESGQYPEFPPNALNWSQSSPFTMISTTSVVKTIQQSSGEYSLWRKRLKISDLTFV